MKERRYKLSFSALVDRLSIVTLKSVKIFDNKEEYEKEAEDIIYDLDSFAEENNINIKDFGKLIRNIQLNAIINEMIWSNESFVRKGDNNLSKDVIADKLQLTHSLNRNRNLAMNKISDILNERKDLKLDYMDDKLTKEYGYDFNKVFD